MPWLTPEGLDNKAEGRASRTHGPETGT